MKQLLSLAAILLIAGCASNRSSRDLTTGVVRPWEPAQLSLDHSATPVTDSTAFQKHIWTDTPVPTVPPVHDDWRE
jgi:hypothetical protein